MNSTQLKLVALRSARVRQILRRIPLGAFSVRVRIGKRKVSYRFRIGYDEIKGGMWIDPRGTKAFQAQQKRIWRGRIPDSRHDFTDR